MKSFSPKVPQPMSLALRQAQKRSKGNNASPPLPSAVRSQANSSAVFQNASQVNADADSLKKNSLRIHQAQNQAVERERKTFEPNLTRTSTSFSSPNLQQHRATPQRQPALPSFVQVTLQRPPKMIHMSQTPPQLASYLDTIYCLPPMHRYVIGAGCARTFQGGVESSAEAFVAAQSAMKNQAERDHFYSVLHLFFYTFLPLLPTSGASSQSLSMSSFDVIFAFIWSSLDNAKYTSVLGTFSAPQLAKAWHSIKRSVYRMNGVSLDDDDTDCFVEKVIRPLIQTFLVVTKLQDESFAVSRRDCREVVGDMFDAFCSQAKVSGDHSIVLALLIDEVVNALYIAPAVISKKHAVSSVDELCEFIISVCKWSNTPLKVANMAFLRNSIHRCMLQRPGLYGQMKERDTIRMRVGIANHAPGNSPLLRPSMMSLTGIAIRAAIFHGIIPSSIAYCTFIEELRLKNGPIAPPASDWDAIDSTEEKQHGEEAENSLESLDFDAFALKQFCARGFVMPKNSPDSSLGASASPLVSAIINIFLGAQPTDPASSNALLPLLPKDSAQNALSVLLHASTMPIFSAVPPLSLDDIRMTLLRWIACGVVPEFITDVRMSCGSFTTNYAKRFEDVQSLSVSNIKQMREGIVAEATAGLRFVAPLHRFSVGGALPEVASESQSSPQSMEYIEASEVLELDADDFAAADDATDSFTSSNTSKTQDGKRTIPLAIRRIIDYNATLDDVAVAERIRITLQRAQWTSGDVTLSNTLPLAKLAKAILWNSYSRTTTRNLRRFLSYFPEHFEIFIVGEKDVWVRVAPNAPAGGPIVPPLKSAIPVIPHGTDHVRAQPPPAPALKHGDIVMFCALVSQLRPLIQAQLMSAMAQLDQKVLKDVLGRDSFEIPPEIYQAIGAEDRNMGRNTLGFTIRELAPMIGGNVKRLRQAFGVLPPSLGSLVSTLSISPENSGDSFTTVLEQRDENFVLVFGEAVYTLEYIRFLLMPIGVNDCAQKAGISLWRTLHGLAATEAAPESVPRWEKALESVEQRCQAVGLKEVSKAIFNFSISALLSAKLDSGSFSSTMKAMSAQARARVEQIELLPDHEATVIAVIDGRSIEQFIGWKDQMLNRNARGVVVPMTLEKRLQSTGFSVFMDSFSSFVSCAEVNEMLKGNMGNRRLHPLRTFFTDRPTSGGVSAVIVEQSMPGGDKNTSQISLRVEAFVPPSPVDIAMAELFKRRVDKRLAALPNIPLGSVVAATSGAQQAVMHNQSHAGLHRFASLPDAVAPPKAPPTVPTPQGGATTQPPPIPNFATSVSTSYYSSFGQTFSHLLSEAKRRCIPQRRYFDPLIQFIADTTFAIFEVILPALDVQNSGGANRLERFAQVSGYAAKCQYKVGSLESFISHWDGLFLELMGSVSNLPEHRSEGYVREFRGRVTRRLLYSRFFRPLLCDVTAAVEVKDAQSGNLSGGTAKGSTAPPPPPIGRSVGKQGMSSFPPSQQGISVDEVAAACQYEYLFQARFGPLQSLLMDFGEFRLHAQENQSVGQKADCFVSPHSSAGSLHMDYRAVFIPSPPDNADTAESTAQELESSKTLLSFIHTLRTISPSPLPPNAPSLFIPIDPLMRFISTRPPHTLASLFKACCVLLPTCERVLGKFVDAAQPSQPPSFAMLKQFAESLVALFPLHIQLVFGEKGPTGASVVLPPAPIPPSWIKYFERSVQPVVAPCVWQALGTAGSLSALIPIKEIEKVISWRRDASKPFRVLPMHLSPANQHATIPLYPLLHRMAEASQCALVAEQRLGDCLRGVAVDEGKHGEPRLVIRVPAVGEEGRTELPQVIQKHVLVKPSFFRTEVPLVLTDPCAMRRMCYGGEQLGLIANGIDPLKARIFRLMYAVLLSDGTVMSREKALHVLSTMSLKALTRLDEGGLLASMAPPSAPKPRPIGDSPAGRSSAACGIDSVRKGAIEDDMRRMDAYYKRQTWHANRNSGVNSETQRRRLLFGDAAVGEGFAESSTSVEEDFEKTLAQQQELAQGQVYGRSTPGTIVTSDEGLVKKASRQTDAIPLNAPAHTLEGLVGLPLVLLRLLISLIPLAPISIAELSRIVGIPPEPLYWSLRAASRLAPHLEKHDIADAFKIEVQITWDSVDALVWLRSG